MGNQSVSATRTDPMASHPLKKRKLTPSASDAEAVGKTRVQKSFFKNAASWNLGEDYESTWRGKKKKAKEPSRLPIKTPSGRLELQEGNEQVESVVSDDEEWLHDDGDVDVNALDEAPKPPDAPQLPERVQIQEAQEELAKIASHLNENPEANAGGFKALARIGASKIPAIQKLGIVTQMTVYKDVIPGYRIRPAKEQAIGLKLSKEVKRVQAYETALVSGYQAYLRMLAQYAKEKPTPGDKPGQDVSSIALTCACILLGAVPHFNFRELLLQIVVKKLSGRRVDASFVKCREAIETLFREDQEGRPSTEAVSLLTKMMRARDFKMHESVLNTFLSLRLLSEFSGTASSDSIRRAKDAGCDGKKPKQVKSFINKKEKKRLKEQKEIDKVMAAADASVSHQEREQMQGEMLKMVFAAYFRILQLRSPHLMGATLEGLAKYAHLINQDFFGDLLEALGELVQATDQANETDMAQDQDDDQTSVVRDVNREALLCTVTAFALLAGQEAHNSRSTLHLDLTFFTTHLYRSLLSLAVKPDLELGAKSLRRTNPHDALSAKASDGQVNVQTTTVLLLRCLQGVLLPRWNIRSVPPLRLAAFTKQLMSASLHMPAKSCQAMLGLLQDVVHTHAKKMAALWNTEERRGDGVFNPLSESVEGSNPFAATVWEGEMLRRHYCPHVREAVKMLEKSLANVH